MISIHEEGGLSALSEAQTRFDDGDLVDGLRTDSRQAWVEIMSVYRPKVHATALRFTRNHHDAEDITQETFLRAFRAAPRFRGESSLGTWLTAIAANLARNRYWYWRRRKRDETVSLDGPAQYTGAVTLGDTLASEDPGAAAQSERDDLLKQLEEGMAALPVRDRRILALRDRQHATYDEIARSLVIPMGTVKSRIARAREHLREVVRRNIALNVDISARGAGSTGAIPITKSMIEAKNTALGG